MAKKIVFQDYINRPPGEAEMLWGIIMRRNYRLLFTPHQSPRKGGGGKN